jgi:hypothetical protein
MDAGRFLFNLNERKRDRVQEDLKAKLVEFFEWYSTFQNKKPITSVEIATIDFKCHSCGFIPTVNTQFSVVGQLIDQRIVIDLLKELTAKYQFELVLKDAA